MYQSMRQPCIAQFAAAGRGCGTVRSLLYSMTKHAKQGYKVWYLMWSVLLPCKLRVSSHRIPEYLHVVWLSAVCCIAGATYWQMSLDSTSGAFDRVASLWFAASVVLLQPAANASSIINLEKDVLRRELSNGMYKFSSFYIAKSLTSLPFQLLFASVFTVGVYFSVGYQLAVAKFFGFFLIMVLIMLISETMGTAAGALHRNPTVGLILVSAICLLLMMYTGFIQTKTPVYFEWLKKVRYLSFHSPSQ